MSPIIELAKLSYAYPTLATETDAVWVLNGIDLSIQVGEFVALMGGTGAGKTTLCLALNGIVPHSLGGTIGGNVFVDGRNTKALTVADLAQTVGLVFQRPETQLFNLTVEAEIAFGLETIGLPLAEIEARIDWSLALVEMSDHRQRSPFELSGGQKQRVAIAAILAMKPPVLVLDEPTANLDPAGKREVFAAVDRLRWEEGITIIMVSHESEQIADFADRVLILDQGKIVLDGPPTAIFSPAKRLIRIGLNTPQVNQLADRLDQKFEIKLQAANFEAAAAHLIRTLADGRLAIDETLNPSVSSHISSDRERILTVEKVAFQYPGNLAAINNISITLNRADFVALVGQNGSGKTTLAKQLNGLLRPSAGKVRLKGDTIAGLTVPELARSIGFVFQNPDHMIFCPTVKEEIAAGPRHLGFAGNKINDLIEQMLTLFGLNAYADTQPALLSFGLRRKVSVAAVVAMQTEILILDEPTSGIDQKSILEMMTLLTRLNRQGRTIIMITHDMNLVAEYIPTVMVMDAGNVTFHGSASELFTQVERLQKTGLERPQVTRLGEILGISKTILSVAELSDCFRCRNN